MYLRFTVKTQGVPDSLVILDGKPYDCPQITGWCEMRFGRYSTEDIIRSGRVKNNVLIKRTKVEHSMDLALSFYTWLLPWPWL